MKRLGIAALSVCWAASVAAAAAPTLRPALHPGATSAAAASVLTKAVDLRTNMRTLWEDHIVYTRNFIISTLADLPDQQAVTQRLLANQKHIGDAVKPYYGVAAGDKLSGLLRDHILIAAGVVKAAKAGDRNQLEKAQRRWNSNGKDIAGFLSAANANWPMATLESMLQKHLDFTTGEVVSRLQKNWVDDIKSYDDGHLHMLMFADVLTDGIVRQFPDKFLN